MVAAVGPLATPTVSTRQRLLDAAATLFLTQGYSKVTMADIATELGISKKTIYQEFSSKEELLLAALDAFFAEIQAQLDAVLTDPTLAFPERLRRVLATVGRRVGGIQGRALQDLRRTAPRGWRHLETLRRQVILTQLTRLLDTGRAAGMVRPDLQPEVLVLMLLALIERVASPDTLAEAPVPTAEVFHTVSTVFFEGVLTDAARPSSSQP